MSKSRLMQVKLFNATVDVYGMSKSYWMTTGTGAMHEPLRQRGWVVFQSPKLGDDRDFARWFPNKREALLELEATA
jgi:hypothetical protein